VLTLTLLSLSTISGYLTPVASVAILVIIPALTSPPHLDQSKMKVLRQSSGQLGPFSAAPTHFSDYLHQPHLGILEQISQSLIFLQISNGSGSMIWQNL